MRNLQVGVKLTNLSCDCACVLFITYSNLTFELILIWSIDCGSTFNKNSPINWCL